MKSVVLKDRDRLNAVVGDGFTFEWDVKDGQGSAMFWNDGMAFKFIIPAFDGPIIIGPIRNHSTLFSFFRTLDLPVDEAKEAVKQIDMEVWGRRHHMVGAGQVSVEGEIVAWTSSAFRVETPEQLHTEIEQEITRLFQAGELKLT